ncbi:MAG: lysophospholipid acyltransferase family protein, partial [Candidatus Omnitrophica bacterium]|nr:lysophospholipid acyltransferase family protein [Candidatus Omnitrophota bacterium]
LSAHLGNWELGGAVLGTMGYKISGVVLTHKNKRINDFFTRQRLAGNMRPIEIGAALKGCYRALRSNELLALLGDRDFSKNGVKVKFFGMDATMPKGPAVLSHRLGSPIVPIFMVREPDDTFTLFIEKPITGDPGDNEEAAVFNITQKCSAAIEACVRKYPSQWYAFRKIWNKGDEKSLRPDTII